MFFFVFFLLSHYFRFIRLLIYSVGPDWQSRLRSISAPRHPDAKPTLPVALIERNIHFIRPYPQNWQRTEKEWRYFTDAPIEQSSSKRNHFNQIHLRSLEDLGDENMFMSKIGRKKKVLDARNGLGQRSEGDKSYQAVEQSTDYHKIASPVPQVNFGRERKPYGDRRTFVPMKNERISIVNENDFLDKERQREYKTIVDEVVQLEKWKPAGRVSSAFKVFDPDANEKTGGKYRPRVR